MNVLITGAAGFIGSHLADRFLADGHRVSGLDNLSTGSRANVADAVDFYGQDVRNIAVVIEASGVTPDLIVHCAASYKDPDKWHRDTYTNVLGTIDVTIAAKSAGCPIVYMQTALPPVSSYAISKTAGMQYIQQSGVPHLIFRLANIYGPRNLSGPIPTFYKRLTEDLPCTVVDTTRDMVYIDDLVECVTRAVTLGALGTYDVCSGDTPTILALYWEVANALGIPIGDRNHAVVQPAADEARTELSLGGGLVSGWTPSTQIKDGIRAAVAWYRDNPPAETFTHLRMEPANV